MARMHSIHYPFSVSKNTAATQFCAREPPARIFRLTQPLSEPILGFSGEQRLLRRNLRKAATARAHEEVGNLFAAGRLFMQAGRQLLSASVKSSSPRLEEEGMTLLDEAVRCFRSEMALYGHMRRKTKGEMLWEFDYPMIRAMAEHPANYLLIARCLKLFGDGAGSAKAMERHRQLYGRMLYDQSYLDSVRLLELRRKVMGCFFSHGGHTLKALKIVRAEEELLSRVSNSEAASFLLWFRGLFNMKNPFKEKLGTREIAEQGSSEMRTN